VNKLKISVIIPFYNTPKLLFLECLHSVKKLKPFEIILVDDCSSDEEIIRIAKDSGCIYLKTPFQSGFDGMPFNLGVKVAKGEYICRVDSDDVLLALPEEVKTDVYLGNVARVKIPPSFNLEELILAPRAIFNAMVIKKELLDKYPLAEDFNVFADVLLMLRLLYNKHSFDRHKTVNYVYRKRAGSIQSSKPQFYHRLRLVQTVARFCQLENIDPKHSIYYLELAMMNVKHGSSSLKNFRKAKNDELNS
jgi:glycosyltransferase involved in cell wall biosynthesis